MNLIEFHHKWNKLCHNLTWSLSNATYSRPFQQFDRNGIALHCMVWMSWISNWQMALIIDMIDSFVALQPNRTTPSIMLLIFYQIDMQLFVLMNLIQVSQVESLDNCFLFCSHKFYQRSKSLISHKLIRSKWSIMSKHTFHLQFGSISRGQ